MTKHPWHHHVVLNEFSSAVYYEAQHVVMKSLSQSDVNGNIYLVPVIQFPVALNHLMNHCQYQQRECHVAQTQRLDLMRNEQVVEWTVE
jgi:hypothetical protein